MIRRDRRLRGAAFAAAIAAVAVGGLVTTATAAAKPKPGRYYGGSTSQQSPLAFSLTPDGRAIAVAHVFIDGSCDDGDRLRYSESIRFRHGLGEYAGRGEHVLPGGRVARSGRFRSGGSWSTDRARVTETFNGKVTGKGGASGTFRVIVEFVDASGATVARCDSGTIRWSARSARGRVYAGVSSTDQPVVVEIDRRGRSLQHVRFGWSAPCNPPESGRWLIADDFRGIPLQRGAFSLALPVAFEIEDGGRRAVHYSLAGHVREASASGTVSVQVTDIDASGAPTSTCDSGRVSWTARSG